MEEHTFRVQKIISNQGFCSRRAAEQLIQEGRVKVNGKTITIGDKASIKDNIRIDNKPLLIKKINEYYLLNKPKGYLTTLSDPSGNRTIVDLIKKNGIKSRLIPVGRLDMNTEGLLILTTDGDYANRVMHPSFEVQKTYEAEIDIPLSPGDKFKLETGVSIMGRKTWPAKVKILSKNNKVLEITIHEGRNRIIRKMLKALGYSVTNLKRTGIGNLRTCTLKVGQIRKLGEKDKEMVFSKKSF